MIDWKPVNHITPRDRDVIVWFDHEADPYQDPSNPASLTDYGVLCEGGDFLEGRGVTVACWSEQVWESIDEYGGGHWLPAGWFSRGDFSHYDVVCNPTHWAHIDAPNTPI